MISIPLFSNDRYWSDPNTELKKAKQELIDEIERHTHVIESCKELIKSYQKQLQDINKEEMKLK